MSDDRAIRDAQLATQMAADVGVEHVAAVYAEALLGAAETAGQTEAVLDEFDDLVAQVLDPSPRLERLLASRLISHDEKAGILDRVLGGRASPTMLHFLKVVSRHGRLDCLRAIHRQTRGLYDKMRGRVVVQVISAVPVDDQLAERIVQSIRPLLDGEPLLRRTVDPKLIGGIVVRVGDTVYDGSIAAQLNSVRQQMIDRSAHEIQSRRDRFRYPAGN
jgi:F-type H+-transporting ATPase subunit delta